MEILKMTNDYMDFLNTDTKKLYTKGETVFVQVHFPSGFVWDYVGQYWQKESMTVMGTVSSVKNVFQDHAFIEQYVTISDLSCDNNDCVDIIPYTVLYQELVKHNETLRVEKIKGDLGALCQLHTTPNIKFVRTKEELNHLVTVLRRCITKLFQQTQDLF